MEVKVILCFVCIFVQKVCLVVDQVCGLLVECVVNLLKFLDKKVVYLIKKVVELVIVNVENNQGVDVDELKVQIIMVDEGLILKCFMVWVKGCGICIFKCISYIIVVVGVGK